MPSRIRLALLAACCSAPLAASLDAHAQMPPHEFDTVVVWAFNGANSGVPSGGSSGHRWLTLTYAPTEEDPEPNEENQCDNPVDIVTGMKFEDVVDFAHAALPDLRFERTYNQAWNGGVGLLGSRWITNHDLKLSTVRWPNHLNPESTPCYPIAGRATCMLAPSAPVLYAHRPGGGIIEFAWNAATNAWVGETPFEAARITHTGSEFLLAWPEGRTERYSGGGSILQRLQADGTGLTYEYGIYNRLQRVRHTAGPSMAFTWANRTDADHLMEAIDPAGQVYRFTHVVNYNRTYARAMLTGVAYPGGLGNVTYHLDPDTRYVGKSIAGTRFTWYAYDNSGRVVESKKSNGIDLKQYAYSEKGTLRTNALGLKVDYAVKDGRIVGTTGHATPSCPTTTTLRTFDSEGRLASTVDELGRKTTYDRDADGRVSKRTENAGGAQQRVTTYAWDSADRQTRVTVQGHSETEYAYSPQNLLQRITRRDLTPGGTTQVTTFSYTRHANGMLDQVVEDGPLPGTGDATTYRYASNGNLLSITNSLGHATTFSLHDSMGRAGRVTGPNGDVREMQYDARGNVVLTRRVTSGGNHEVGHVFDAANRLSATVTSDGVRTDFAYDAAHRLVTEARREPAGTYAVRQIGYNAESLPTSVRTERTPTHPFPVHAAKFVSHSIPTGMVAGKTYPVTVRLRNAGNVPWRASDGYRLTFTAPAAATPWTTGNTVPLPSEVAPGADVVFQFNVVAPRSTSALSVQWRMTRDGVGVFGDATPVVSVPATLVYRAELVSQVVPDWLAAGTTGTVTVRVRNTGTHAWNVAGEPKVVLARDNASYPMPAKVYASGAIQPGQIATFTYTVGPLAHSWQPYRLGGAIWMENITFLFKLPEASMTVHTTTGHCPPGEIACEQPI